MTNIIRKVFIVIFFLLVTAISATTSVHATLSTCDKDLNGNYSCPDTPPTDKVGECAAAGKANGFSANGVPFTNWSCACSGAGYAYCVDTKDTSAPTCTTDQTNRCMQQYGNGSTCYIAIDQGQNSNGGWNSFCAPPFKAGAGSISLQNPFGTTSPDNTISFIENRVLVIFLFAVGLVLFGLVFYAGFLYLTDAANEENTKKAKEILTAAVIGIAIIASTGLIIKFIDQILGIHVLGL